MRSLRWGALLIGLAATALAAMASTGMASRALAARVLSPADRALYTAAFEKAEHDDFAAAQALAGRAADPLLRKVLTWMELIRPVSTGDFVAIVQFRETHPEWPGQEALRTAAELSMPAGLSTTAVLTWFDATPPGTPEGTLRYLEALRATGQEDRARSLARVAWVELNFTRSDEASFLRRFGDLLTQAEQEARLERLIWDRRRLPALRQARRLGADREALAEARLALATMAPGVDRAIEKVPPALRDDPGLTYERARWRLRKDRYGQAVELLDPPLEQLAAPERWWDLRHWAARRALEEGEPKRAYRLASFHGLSSGADFAEAEFLSGWIALRFLDNPTVAYGHFQRLYDAVGTPISRARGAYWAGEAAQALDRPAEATRWYRLAAFNDIAFYGQLATGRLGGEPTLVENPPAQISARTRADFDSQEVVQVLRRLVEIDQDRLIDWFFAALRVRAQSEVDFRLIGDLALALDRVDQAVVTAKAASREGIVLPAHLFPSIPLSLDGPGEGALVLALIRQESQFSTRAVSRAGARGLMQLMPATAKHVAARQGLPFDPQRLTEDPSYNLRLGRHYLEDLLARYDGSYALALAAYNAGPARANRWIEEFGDPRDPKVDPIDWIESIPFDETRNYVQRVLEAVAVYRKRLSPGQPLLPVQPYPHQTTELAPPSDAARN